MNLKMITDATAEPVALADIKLFCGLSTVSTVEDALLTGMIKAARQQCEAITRRPCLPQTFLYETDDFPDQEFVLMRAPLSTSTADVTITYLDAASGDSTTLPSTYYVIDHNSEPGRICLADGSEWPDHWTQRNAVKVQFVAGCTVTTAEGFTTDNCPEDVELWIKLRVKQMYDNRDAYHTGNMNAMPHSFFDGLLDRHILIDVRP